ncbi:MAG: Ku protein [Acetobacteraceae bacterium]|nr:Ku protein [Acetobacteraceae bacterium]
MAERPIWRGHLRLALVSCPVALYTARHERGNLRFHYINPKTGNRVRMVTLDAETDEELSRGALVRGYEFKKDHYVVLSNEDFENARIESTSTMNVEKFVQGDSIDPIYYDSAYFMVPDGKAGQDVYVVLREAIRQTGRVALSRVVISRRERAIALRPMDRGMVAHTLHEEQDVASPAKLFEEVPDIKPDPEMVKLAIQLIDRQTGVYDPADMEDRYEARLRAVIDAKLKGEGIEPEAAEEPDRGNVIDLMAALKRSLGQTPDQPPEKPVRAAAAGRRPEKKTEPPPAEEKKPRRKRA